MPLSIVVPMHDESPNVRRLVREVATAFADLPGTELLIVDDGSTDDTAALVQAAMREFPALRLIRLGQQSGQSTAIWTGVQAAGGTLLGVLDGDLQNDPADLRRLVQQWHDEGDAARRAGRPDDLGMLIGERTRRRDTVVRRLSSRIANGVRRRLLDDGIRDTGCGLKLLERRVFLQLPYFDHMHRFMPALVRQAGLRVVPVPVNHRPRHAGRSKYGIGNRLWVGLVDLVGVAWLARRNRRTAWREVLRSEPVAVGPPDRGTLAAQPAAMEEVSVP
ncbi:MAG: glycosyltransferase family 2 protein [Chromatiales bacterium]|nr:glycosyltransferase family 2 protein [Chromatiales bacterium]